MEEIRRCIEEHFGPISDSEFENVLAVAEFTRTSPAAMELLRKAARRQERIDDEEFMAIVRKAARE